MLDEEYDEFGTFGHKVDLIFHAHGQELANLEFKVAQASQVDIEIQNRKNIWLNRAIMESQYAACEVKSTILFLDFQGWYGSLFALHPFEDIFVAKYLGSVELPRSPSGLRRFLQGASDYSSRGATPQWGGEAGFAFTETRHEHIRSSLDVFNSTSKGTTNI
ncbi:hypothetical protein BGX28_008857 [Mortierella sp. GBA30]|nr:hypothetical protein BGX28_008857 [Mortierella sp. GBA30]